MNIATKYEHTTYYTIKAYGLNGLLYSTKETNVLRALNKYDDYKECECVEAIVMHGVGPYPMVDMKRWDRSLPQKVKVAN